MKGWQRSFHQLPMAVMRSRTLVKVPPRMAWQAMMPKKIILSLAVCGYAELGRRVEDGDWTDPQQGLGVQHEGSDRYRMVTGQVVVRSR